MIKDLFDADEFDCRAYYGINYSGLEDDATFNDYGEMEDWVWDKLQDGLFVEVNGVRFNPDMLVYCDEAYGIEDYLDESVSNKNSKKVNEGYATDTSDIDGMVDAVLDFVYAYDYWNAADSGSIDQDTSEFTEDAIEETRAMIENKDEILADYLSEIIDTLGPSERYDGKIEDIIDYIRGYDTGEKLTPMATKNEAMERVNTSDFDKWCIKNVGPKVNAFIKELDNKIKSGKVDKENLKDLGNLISYVAGEIFEIVTEAVKPYVEGNKKTDESLDEDDYKADDDFTDGEAKTDENMNESLEGFKKLPVKSFDRKPSEQTRVQQDVQLEDEVADESFAHDDSM